MKKIIFEFNLSIVKRETHFGKSLITRLEELKSWGFTVYNLKCGKTNSEWIIEYGDSTVTNVTNGVDSFKRKEDKQGQLL